MQPYTFGMFGFYKTSKLSVLMAQLRMGKEREQAWYCRVDNANYSHCSHKEKWFLGSGWGPQRGWEWGQGKRSGQLEMDSVGGDKTCVCVISRIRCGSVATAGVCKQSFEHLHIFFWLDQNEASLKTAPSSVVISARALGGPLQSRQAGCHWL